MSEQIENSLKEMKDKIDIIEQKIDAIIEFHKIEFQQPIKSVAQPIIKGFGDRKQR